MSLMYFEDQCNKPIKCLEFFAGIGGFHLALRVTIGSISTISLDAIGSNIIVRAIDINTTTNCIYRSNFPETDLQQRNIQALNASYYDEYDADIWAMSPPCQPFTKKGLKRDICDRRCDALKSVCNALIEMKHPPRHIILENVRGFETSQACSTFFFTLCSLGYLVQEYILSPTDMGIPNSRPRYYLLAKHQSSAATTQRQPCLKLLDGTHRLVESKVIGDFLCVRESTDESDITSCMHLIKSMNLVTSDSTNSACFTKSYSRYVAGTGSLLVWSDSCKASELDCDNLRSLLVEDAKQPVAERRFHVRYLTWREVANLLGFPSNFQKPPEITTKQMHRALGNSLSVDIVKLLIAHLIRM